VTGFVKGKRLSYILICL